MDFRGSSEAPGGPRRLPRGSQRSLEICDCLLVFRRFFGCGPRERDAQGGGGRLAVLPFPSPAFPLPLLLPSPPSSLPRTMRIWRNSRHSYSKCPSGPQSSQIPTTSRASSSTAAPSGPMCATGSSIGQGGSEREFRVQSNFRVAPPQVAGSIPSPPRSPPSEPPRAGSLLGSVAPVDEPARSPHPRPSFSSSLDASILRLIVAAPRSTQ